MRTLLRLCALSVLILAYPLTASAQAPQGVIGSWKQNIAKSTYTTGTAPKSQSSRWETMPGGAVKISGDVVDAAGKATHNESVTMFDGKEVELKGADQPTTRAYSRIDDRNYQFVTRVNGKVTTTIRGTVAPDGKTRTLVQTGMGTDGKAVSQTTVWDKQ